MKKGGTTEFRKVAFYGISNKEKKNNRNRRKKNHTDEEGRNDRVP
jgi:hypothetical protein